MGKKSIILLASLCIFIGIATVVALTLYMNHREEMARIEAIEEERFRTAEAYFRLHYALGWTANVAGSDNWELFFGCDSDQEWALRNDIYYRPMRDWHRGEHPFGLECTPTYANLKLYEHRTGNVLSYERILEYLSEEFESDGSLRLYNNGKHPDVESFVNWSWGRREEQLEYIESLSVLLFWYFEDYAGDEFERRSILHLSPQMMDALARAEADSTYVLELTSLYRQGY
jgi:hypothetical protein